MFERTSDTGWFEYSGSDVPDDVVTYLRDHDDVHHFEQNGDEVEFFSQDGTLVMGLYDEDSEDGFEETGVFSSQPVRTPSDLPSDLRNSVTIGHYLDDADLAAYIRDLSLGDDDPREYTLNGRFSLSLDAVRNRQYSPPTKQLEPMPIEDVQDAANDGLVRDNTGTDYPTVSQMVTWANAFDDAFDDATLYAIGSVQGAFMFDGVVINVEVTDNVESWVRARFDGDSPSFDRASEVQFYDGEWVRLWWD